MRPLLFLKKKVDSVFAHCKQQVTGLVDLPRENRQKKLGWHRSDCTSNRPSRRSSDHLLDRPSGRPSGRPSDRSRTHTDSRLGDPPPTDEPAGGPTSSHFTALRRCCPTFNRSSATNRSEHSVALHDGWQQSMTYSALERQWGGHRFYRCP